MLPRKQRPAPGHLRHIPSIAESQITSRKCYHFRKTYHMEGVLYKTMNLHQNMFLPVYLCGCVFWPSYNLFSVWKSPLREVILSLVSNFILPKTHLGAYFKKIDFWVPLQRLWFRRFEKEINFFFFFKMPKGFWCKVVLEISLEEIALAQLGFLPTPCSGPSVYCIGIFMTVIKSNYFPTSSTRLWILLI